MAKTPRPTKKAVASSRKPVAKPKASAPSTAKPSAKTKPSAKVSAPSKPRSRASADPAAPVRVPAAVAATLASAQEHLAALNEMPAPSQPHSTDQQALTVAPVAFAPRLAAPRPLGRPMPRAFWPAIDILCDYPDAVREAYRRGESGPGTALRFLRVILLAAAAYGAAMGATHWLQGESGYAAMIPIAALKMPLLLIALYAFAALPLCLITRFLGYPFTFVQAAKLLLAASSVSAAVLAGTIPIAILFALTGADYPIMQALHALLLIMGGAVGALFYTTRCHAIHGSPARVRPLALMVTYLVLFAIIATQVVTVTGPFIGAPDAPIAALRSDAWVSVQAP